MKTRIVRLVLLVSSFSLSYCVSRVPRGNPAGAEMIEVDSCAAVRAHLSNHPGDQSYFASECGA